jgi:hypothetical protein
MTQRAGIDDMFIVVQARKKKVNEWPELGLIPFAYREELSSGSPALRRPLPSARPRPPGMSAASVPPVRPA